MTVQKLNELKERTTDVEILEALELASEYKNLYSTLEKMRDLKIKLVSKKTFRWFRTILTVNEIVQLDQILYEMKE